MIDNRENNIWTVYVHIVPKSITEYDYDKYYVGITSRSVNERWGSNGHSYFGQLFYNIIQKYGWNNIEHYIVAEKLTKNEAENFEQTLIKNLKCNVNNNEKYGYNVTKGGNVITGYKHTKEIKEKMKKIQQSIRGIETYQFDLNFNFINKYCTAQKAAEINNIFASHIQNCLNNKYYSYNNYIWRRKEDVKIIDGVYTPINLIKKPNIKRKIYQFDLNGNFIASYDRLNKVLDFNNSFNTHNIYQCLNHIHETSYGYIWRYEKDKDVIISEDGIPRLNYIYKKKSRKNYRHIYQFDLKGNFIKDYQTCKEASEYNHIDHSYLLKKIKTTNKSFRGFFWRDENNIKFNNGRPILLNKGDDELCL